MQTVYKTVPSYIDEEANIVDFNPWGRPGAGAPIKDIHGEDINDYLIRKVSIQDIAFTVLQMQYYFSLCDYFNI